MCRFFKFSTASIAVQSTKLPPFRVFFENGPEFHHLKNELFTQDTYYFETTNPQPRIIDAGAHIGLTTLYFKKLYPHARITAIEANPAVWPIFEKNVFENQLEDVGLQKLALADAHGEKSFYIDATQDRWLSTASFTPGAWTGSQESESITVPTVPLTDLLLEGQPVDFLKMDIEGAEQAVLFAAKDKLHLIHHLFLEFHPISTQSLTDLVEFLQQNGFRIQLWKDGKDVTNKKFRGLVYVEGKRY
jgi:FkbM family methyltransferase